MINDGHSTYVADGTETVQHSVVGRQHVVRDGGVVGGFEPGLRQNESVKLVAVDDVAYGDPFMNSGTYIQNSDTQTVGSRARILVNSTR